MDAGQDGSLTTATTGGRSVWKNFSDAIFAPGETFEDVGRRPWILVPLLLLMAAVLIVSWFHMPVWSEIQTIKVAANPDLSPEQREAAVAGMEKFMWVGLLVTPVGFALVLAVSALIFWGWAAISGARNADYKVAYSSLIFASVVIVLQMVLQAVVIGIKGAGQVAREGGPPLFGLSLFLDRDDFPRLVWGLLASLNFFSIWYTVLVVIAGVHALKMSRGSAIAVAAAMFLVGAVVLSFQGAT
ncbi:MAG: YIP1 family protein [Gemmatimonadota bacterium]